MKIKINENTLVINEGASISHIEVPLSKEQPLSIVSNAILGDTNYKTVEFIEDSDRVSGRYTDCILVDNTYTVIKSEDEEEETSMVVFAIREKTSVEKRLDVLEESQVIQDGAIADLGDVVSEMMEG